MMHHRLRPPSRILLRPRPLAPLGTTGRGHFAARDRAITEAWEGYQRRERRRHARRTLRTIAVALVTIGGLLGVLAGIGAAAWLIGAAVALLIGGWLA